LSLLGKKAIKGEAKRNRKNQGEKDREGIEIFRPAGKEETVFDRGKGKERSPRQLQKKIEKNHVQFNGNEK